MSKRKNTIKNTYNITNEIDYDKLAEAIVAALDKTDKNQQNKNTLSKGLAKMASFVFLILSALVFVFAMYIFFSVIIFFIFLPDCKYEHLYQYILFPIILIVLIIILVIISVFFWKVSEEIEKEKDKNYLITLFSSMVSVAALVVAILSLTQFNK